MEFFQWCKSESNEAATHAGTQMLGQVSDEPSSEGKKTSKVLTEVDLHTSKVEPVETPLSAQG